MKSSIIHSVSRKEVPHCQILVIFLTLEILNMNPRRFLENAVLNMKKQDRMTPFQFPAKITLLSGENGSDIYHGHYLVMYLNAES